MLLAEDSELLIIYPYWILKPAVQLVLGAEKEAYNLSILDFKGINSL